MGRIGHLVRIDPDKARLDPAVELGQIVRRKRRLFAEVVTNAWCQQREEGRMMPQLHLAKQALTLVDRHGTGLGHRLTQQMARQPLLVTGVTGLVHYAHQAGDKLLLVIAGSDPHVGRHPATEGVAAHIEAAVCEIKAEQPHHLLTERLLGRDGEGALRQQQGIALLLFTHGLDRAGSQLARSPKI